jgi:hypothetical protein
MTRWQLLVLALLVSVVSVRPARADILCATIGRCTYEGAAFRVTVVDAETQQPVPDVHAFAEWVLNGFHGANGPLMVQDAVSGPDGVLRFPAWGPLRGPASGLVMGRDPIISLFRPAYKVLIIQNSGPRLDTSETARQRPVTTDGKTVQLDPFRGFFEGWVAQLEKAAWGGSSGRADEQGLQFKGPYLNRLRRIWAERDNVPQRYQAAGQLLWSVKEEIQFLERGTR